MGSNGEETQWEGKGQETEKWKYGGTKTSDGHNHVHYFSSSKGESALVPIWVLHQSARKRTGYCRSSIFLDDNSRKQRKENCHKVAKNLKWPRTCEDQAYYLLWDPEKCRVRRVPAGHAPWTVPLAPEPPGRGRALELRPLPWSKEGSRTPRPSGCRSLWASTDTRVI